MFKSMLKRSGLSVIRKPSRTAILIAILFVMANMILATLAIKTSVEKSTQYAKESLGTTVYLQPDMDALRANVSMQDPSAGPIRITRPDIPVSMAENIADSNYIKDYTYTVSTRANAGGFSPVETEEQQMRNQIGSGGQMGTTRPGGGVAMMFGFSGDMSIIGINSFAFISEVESGNMKKQSGEIFDESTDNSVMISYELAELNNLSVGDSITVATVNPEDESDTTDITLTIIGIYDTTTDGFNHNTIYMNPKTAAQFVSANSDTEDFSVESVRYFLTSAEDKDTFLAEANAKYPNLTDDKLKLSIDDSAYQQMVGPIESVGSFATTVLWIVMIAAAAIITLIVTINVKDRRYEMGVLLSLGATKKNILGQILLELIVVGTVGLVLSVGTSTFLARSMGNSLLESQISMSQQQSEQNFGRGQSAVRTPGTPTRIQSPFSPAQSNVEPISEIDVTPAPSDYLLLFISSYLIIVLSLIIPSVNVLRYQPKTILTGKE